MLLKTFNLVLLLLVPFFKAKSYDSFEFPKPQNTAHENISSKKVMTSSRSTSSNSQGYDEILMGPADSAANALIYDMSSDDADQNTRASKVDYGSEKNSEKTASVESQSEQKESKDFDKKPEKKQAKTIGKQVKNVFKGYSDTGEDNEEDFIGWYKPKGAFQNDEGLFPMKEYD